MMRDDKLIELFEFYAKGEAGGNWLSSVEPTKLGDFSYGEHWSFDKLRDYEDARRHAAWMAKEAIGFIKEAQGFEASSRVEGLPELTNWEEMYKAHSKREKAHRWLGFIQATLFLCGAYTLNELKEHSRKCSDEPEKEETK